ncbi:MAG: hypothetical protein WD423_11960 [Rhodothermales bacterium]
MHPSDHIRARLPVRDPGSTAIPCRAGTPHLYRGIYLGDTFGVFPENVFLIKLNYTFLY